MKLKVKFNLLRQVQFLPTADGLYSDAIETAIEVEIESATTRIMLPQYLAAIAIQTGRAKDSQRVNEFLRQNIVSTETMKDPIQRFGLVERWQKFQTLYPDHDVQI